MFAEAIEDILRDQCTPEAVRRLATNPRHSGLWDAVASAGFLDAMRPVERDGADLTLAEIHDVVSLFGYYAAPLPFADTIAARALVTGQVGLPKGMLALAPGAREDDDGAWHCARMPFGAAAGHVLARRGEHLILLPCAAAQRGEPDLPGGLTISLDWPAGAGMELEGDAAGLEPMAAYCRYM